jgi:DNA repair exonuclease SbcCD ATPase subunit
MVFVLFWGCSNRTEELEHQNTALQSTNQQLSQDLASRDEYVDKVTSSINDIYAKIEEVRAKEQSILRESSSLEAEKKLTREEVRSRLLDRIGTIRETLHDNFEKLAELQKKLSASSRQYAGLKKMVENLQKSIEERDQSIADLKTHISGLEQQVAEKTTMITQKDSVIDTQYKQITTVYYIMGTRDELEKKGIIQKQGGFPWGIFGSTTILANGFDDKDFKTLNKTALNTIEVPAKIDEILPKRNAQYYTQTELGNDQSMLTIAEPNNFWQDKYLVIITDRPTGISN